MKRLKLALLAIGILPACGGTASGLDVKAYRELSRTHAEQADLNAHLEGFVSGLLYANGQLTYLGQKPLFCSPPNLTLNVGNVLDLLDTTITHMSTVAPEAQVAKLDIEAVLMMALIDEFPCGPPPAKKGAAPK